MTLKVFDHPNTPFINVQHETASFYPTFLAVPILTPKRAGEIQSGRWSDADLPIGRCWVTHKAVKFVACCDLLRPMKVESFEGEVLELSHEESLEVMNNLVSLLAFERVHEETQSHEQAI